MTTLGGCSELEFKTWADPRIESQVTDKQVEDHSVSQADFRESLSIHEMLSVFCREKLTVVETGCSTVFKFGKPSVKNIQESQL